MQTTLCQKKQQPNPQLGKVQPKVLRIPCKQPKPESHHMSRLPQKIDTECLMPARLRVKMETGVNLIWDRYAGFNTSLVGASHRVLLAQGVPGDEWLSA